ncbi:MAG: hypothetical protein ACO1SV_04250 [Fimbriimonas sp.]
MADETKGRLENALICGVIACFWAHAIPWVPIMFAFIGLLIALVAHLVGVCFALSILRTNPYSAVAALALNLSIWLAPLGKGWPFFYT